MERIIVVEDNLTFSGYVCRLLESKGFQTVSTSTCNGARKLFAKMREDDIVLADMRLPDGDGLLEMSLPSLLKNLRERMAQHETPIYERQSVAFREIDHKIRLVAPTNMGVLVLGENGTGKEHIAEKIHTNEQTGKSKFFCRGGLRLAVEGTCRISPVRTRERGVHGCGHQTERVLGGSRRRYAVP